MVWACEYEATLSAQNQLAYDLSSAQYQRRALGFPKHSIYGAAISGSLATLYVSDWKFPDDREKRYVLIERIGQFDLAQPYGAIQYLNFVRSVINYNSGLLKDLDEITVDSLQQAKNQYDGPGSWQARKYPMNAPNPPKKPKTSQDGWRGGKSGGQPAEEGGLIDLVEEVASMDLAEGVGGAEEDEEDEEMRLFDDGCKIEDQDFDLHAWEAMELGQRNPIPKEDVEAWRRKVVTPNMYVSAYGRPL